MRGSGPKRAGVLAFELCGHLALWVGLYMAGVVAAIALMSGIRPGPVALVAAGCTAAGTYLIDRVKLRDRWLDRADRLAHPRRYGFLRRRVHLVRAAALAAGGAGVACAFAVHPLLAIVAGGSFVGVVVYAGLPRSMYTAVHVKRPKDVLIVKNAAVAASMTVFAIALVAALFLGDADRFDAYTVRMLIAGALVGVHVFVDAVLCDLDDRKADARFGTATLPTRFGDRATWRVALVLNAGLAVACIPLGTSATAFGAAMAVTLIALALWRPARVRDLVDLRLPLCAAIALLV